MAIEITRLRYFSTIVARRSLRRAADELHVAQPALSRHVRALEEELGVKLLTRTARGVSPTAGGLALLRASEKLFDQYARLKAEVTSVAATPTGILRIATLPAFSIRFLAGVVAELRAAHPQLEFAIGEGFSQRLQDQVLAGEADVAVLAGLGAHPELVTTPLYREQIWLIGGAAHWRAPRRAVEPAYLARHRLIMSRYFRPVAERALRGRRLDLAVEVDGAAMIAGLIRGGAGLYFGPPTLLWDELRSGELVGTRVIGMSFQRELVRRKDRPETAAIALLLERLRAAIERFAQAPDAPISVSPAAAE